MTALRHQKARVCRSPASASSGFTLIEVALVIVVISLLIGSLLIPLSTKIEQKNIAETRHRLEAIKEALVGYAMTNGRFPCPASATSNGVESFSVSPVGSAANGICLSFDGHVPAATLGLSNVDGQAYAVDAWGLTANRIRYSVSNTTVAGQTNPFTSSGGMHAAGMPNSVTSSVNFLYVCASGTGITTTGCGTAAPLANGNAVFVLLSLGKNAATTGGASTDEAANLDGDRVFVSKTSAGQPGAEFDDIMLWGSQYTVFSKLVAAGLLP